MYELLRTVYCSRWLRSHYCQRRGLGAVDGTASGLMAGRSGRVMQTSEIKMPGYWIAFGWLLASIGIFALVVAKRKTRIDASTYGTATLGLAVAVLALAIGQGWLQYKISGMQAHVSEELESIASEEPRIKAKTSALQERIRINRSAMEEISQPGNLTPTTDPGTTRLRRERVAAFQKEAAAIEEESKSLSNASQALKSRLDKVQSEHDGLKRTRTSKDFLIFLCALGISAVSISSSLLIGRAQRKRISDRNSSFRAQGIDPMALSVQVQQLADAGNKIAAIKLYREETGSGLADSKESVEAYLNKTNG
jgi:hypothetical protein